MSNNLIQLGWYEILPISRYKGISYRFMPICLCSCLMSYTICFELISHCKCTKKFFILLRFPYKKCKKHGFCLLTMSCERCKSRDFHRFSYFPLNMSNFTYSISINHRNIKVDIKTHIVLPLVYYSHCPLLNPLINHICYELLKVKWLTSSNFESNIFLYISAI